MDLQMLLKEELGEGNGQQDISEPKGQKKGMVVTGNYVSNVRAT